MASAQLLSPGLAGPPHPPADHGLRHGGDGVVQVPLAAAQPRLGAAGHQHARRAGGGRGGGGGRRGPGRVAPAVGSGRQVLDDGVGLALAQVAGLEERKRTHDARAAK